MFDTRLAVFCATVYLLSETRLLSTSFHAALPLCSGDS
jgi:hypothetical protein